MQDLLNVGARLVAVAGGNGLAFHNDLPATDWTPGYLTGASAPGLIGSGLAYTGTEVVACGSGHCFRSAAGAPPWTSVPPGVGATLECRLATRGPVVYAAFNQLGGVDFAVLPKVGETWQIFDTLPVYVYELAVHDTTLYAARTDGLWFHSARGVGVPGAEPPADRAGLGFALTGPNPARDEARFRATLPSAGPATLSIFDLAGREVARPFDGTLEAGSRVLRWDGRAHPAGLYFARLAALGRFESTRFIRLP